MADDPGDQWTISDTEEVKADTWQERIIERYNSNELGDVALGFWLKLGAEALIVSVPLFALIVPVGAILILLDIGPLTPFRVIGVWITISASVIGFSWCFTESAVMSDGEGDETTSEDGSGG